MKTMFIILVYLILLLGCFINKPIQVKEIMLTVKKIDPAYRDDREMVWITWVDENRVEYYMICPCVQYKIGDKKLFLITR